MNDVPSDQALLERWRSGDAGAGDSLVRRHFDALVRFFATKSDSAHQEDLIQQTFMACVETNEPFRGESTFRTYLFGVARFQLLTHYRKIYRRSEQELATTSVRDLGTSPTGALVRAQERQLLQLAMQRVPLDQQIALELTFWEGLAAPEVAYVLGIPENTVYSRLRRGKAHLREALLELSNAADERRRVFELLGDEDEDEP